MPMSRTLARNAPSNPHSICRRRGRNRRQPEPAAARVEGVTAAMSPAAAPWQTHSASRFGYSGSRAPLGGLTVAEHVRRQEVVPPAPVTDLDDIDGELGQ